MTKYFNVTNPDNVVTITFDHGNFYQLSDGNMIKKDTFESKYQPLLEGFEHEIIQEKSSQIMNSEYIDPDAFLNASVHINTTEINKLKNINPNNIPEVNDFNRTTIVNKSSDFQSAPQNFNESLVTPIDPKNVVIPNNTKTDVSQYKVYENDDDAYNDFLNKSQSVTPQQKPAPQQQTNMQSQIDDINNLFEDEKIIYGVDEATKRKTKRLNRLYNIPDTMDNKQENDIKITQTITQKLPQMDPFTMMFSTFKRNHEVVFNIQFKDKIANPEFIKMMMENMDGDIVGFYKNKIVDNIMKNISIIEDVVENELKKLIGDEQKIEEENIQEEVKKKVTKSSKVVKKPKTE